MGFQYQLSLNTGQMYCRMFQEEHYALFSAFIKLPFGIKVFVFFFEWPFYTGFTVTFSCSTQLSIRLKLVLFFFYFCLIKDIGPQSKLSFLYKAGNIQSHVIEPLWYMSRDMRFPTMWYVQPAKPQISLRVHAFASHLNIL